MEIHNPTDRTIYHPLLEKKGVFAGFTMLIIQEKPKSNNNFNDDEVEELKSLGLEIK